MKAALDLQPQIEEINRSAKKWKLSALWDEVDLPVEEAPDLGECVVRRLDEEALVLEGNPQVSTLIGLGLLTQVLGLVFAPIFIWWTARTLTSELGKAMYRDDLGIAFDLVLLPILVGALCFAIWACYQLLIKPTPSSIIFNRKTGRVHGTSRGRPIQLDWKRVRPILIRAKVAYAGMQTHYHLVLMNFDPGQAGPMKKKSGYGLMVATGGLYGASQCRQMWEFIRRYMEGKPKDLPEVEVTPEQGWVSKVLDVGPYWEMHEPAERSIETLRQRKGWPVLKWWHVPFSWLLGPALLLNLWQIFLRPRAKLPAEWWPAPSAQPSPYLIRQIGEADLELRRATAQRVVVIWLVLGVGGGCALWFWFWWWLTHH